MSDDLTLKDINFYVSGTTIQKAVRNYVANELGITKSFVENLVKERVEKLFKDNEEKFVDALRNAVFDVIAGKRDSWGNYSKPSSTEMVNYMKKLVDQIVREEVLKRIDITVGVKP